MADTLMCPVCMTLPEDEVHQCNEGHCYCVECWNRLDPRRCPECRQPLPQANRSRAAERAIAALEATCDHCGEAMTRGTKPAHMRACPWRPTACTAAAVGCGWSGVAAEQAAHEAACPIAVCQRMMAPMQARCDGLQARCGGLQARCEGLQVQNQQLQQRVAALEPLADRTRALEGDAEAGARLQRQRVGAAPHDTAPSSTAAQQMGLAVAVAALRAHVAVAHVAEEVCGRVANLCVEVGNRQPAAEAGALEAVTAAMQAHPQAASVQEHGCRALRNVCCGDDADAAAMDRRQRAVEAGALEAVVGALEAHPQAGGVQEEGCNALANVCCGTDAAALARTQRAADAVGPRAQSYELILKVLWP